jgi:hypothetical protein
LRVQRCARSGSIQSAWAELLCSAQSAFCALKQSSSAHALWIGHSARAPQRAYFHFHCFRNYYFVFLRELCGGNEEKKEK